MISLAVGNCVVNKTPCDSDMGNWGAGWSFSPDYQPTGEELFMCGAVANSGGYCNKTDDSVIEQTLTNPNLQYMYDWQDYLAPQLPVMYQPNAPIASGHRWQPATCAPRRLHRPYDRS